MKTPGTSNRARKPNFFRASRKKIYIRALAIEDETGVANLIVRPEIYRRDRQAARHGVVIIARGRVERQGEVVHILVRSIETAETALAELAARSRDFH